MKQWLKDAVFYEIYPQSFYDTNGDGIGDLQGIIAKLDYIKGLGCNALWINPCFDSPFKDAGYDVRDYKKIAQRYGTNEDAAALFKAAHEKGIRVLFDLVPGHTSEKTSGSRPAADPKRTNTPTASSGRIPALPSATVCPSSAARPRATAPTFSTSSSASLR